MTRIKWTTQERAYLRCFVGEDYHVGRALNIRRKSERGWRRWLRWHR